MGKSVVRFLLLGFLTSVSALNATCTRCIRHNQKVKDRGTVVKRSKGWRPTPKAVIESMTPEQLRTQRMNNKRKKALPKSSAQKMPVLAPKNNFINRQLR